MSGVSAVEQFVAEWPEKRPFWELLTQTAHDICKEGLKDRKKLKCHILHRTKEKDSLETKLKKMEEERVQSGKARYTPEEILKAMIDLAGIRILLPFPDDVQEVKAFLEQEFGQDLGEKSGKARFKGLDENGLAVERSTSRFLGYRATHFLVTWRQPGPYNCGFKTNEAHVGKTVEVQVTTILMNGWQEAQHDITYKELSGTPSDDEKALLEMINGLAHSGEVALRQVQKLQKRRVSEESRPFQDVYELIVWFKEWMKKLLSIQIGERWTAVPDLSHVAILFVVLQMKGLRTPGKLNDALRHDDANAVLQAPQDSLAAFTQKSMRDLPSARSGTGQIDLSLWGIMKVCVPAHPWGSISELDAETKAFIIVGAINMAHAGGFSAPKLEQDYRIRLAKVNDQSRERMENALLSIMCFNIDADQHKEEVNKLWRLLSRVRASDEWESFLHASAALLALRMVFLPDLATGTMRGSPPLGRIAWPGELKEDPKDLKASLWRASRSGGGRYVTMIYEPNGNCKWGQKSANDLSWCMCEMVDLNFIHSGEGFKFENPKKTWHLDAPELS